MTRAWIAALLLPLAACGGAEEADVVEQPGPQAAASGEPSNEPSESEAPEEQGQLIDIGFGQERDFATAVGIVENTSDHGGQTVTLSVNFLDDAGQVIATASQLESFAYAGQTIALAVQGDVGRGKVAEIEPTLLIEDESTFDESEVTLDPIESRSIRDNFGLEAEFEIQNPTAEPLQDLRVGIACFNKAGDIIGGGSTYPDLVPPNGTAVFTSSFLTVSEEPASCTAYPSPAGF